MPWRRARVAAASSSSTSESAKPTWMRTQSPGSALRPSASSRPMLTVRRTPATSTRASRLPASTTSMTLPGMARHTATPPQGARQVGLSRESYLCPRLKSNALDGSGLLTCEMPVPEQRDAIERHLLRDTAYEALCEAIVSGTLAPGEMLHDHELCAWLGLSRTPVRGALARLEDEGL